MSDCTVGNNYHIVKICPRDLATAMNLIPARLSSAARYLRGATAPHKWKLCRADCPLCDRSYFLSLRGDPFMTRCLSCRATATNLSLIPIIRKHFNDCYEGSVAYELSTYGSTLDWLRRNFDRVITSEFIPGQPLGRKVNGIHNEDVQQLSFESASIDLISSNQVFEHVPDDLRGFKECLRVLKDGGAMVMSLPLFDRPATQRIATLEHSKVVFIGKPEYHDSRLEGAYSVPVFWHHAACDIAARVKSVGFRFAELVNVSIAPTQRMPARIIYAVK
jgi:SAM-dependent methyltransferase